MPVGRPGITQMITTFLRFKNMSVHGQANHKDWPFPQKPQVHARWVRPMWFPDPSQISQDWSHFQQLSRQQKQAEVRKLPMRLLQNQLARSPGIPWYFRSSTDSTNPETSYLRPSGRQNSSKPQFNSSANVRWLLLSKSLILSGIRL